MRAAPCAAAARPLSTCVSRASARQVQPSWVARAATKDRNSSRRSMPSKDSRGKAPVEPTQVTVAVERRPAWTGALPGRIDGVGGPTVCSPNNAHVCAPRDGMASFPLPRTRPCQPGFSATTGSALRPPGCFTRRAQ